MSMKKTDLEKHLAKKLDGRMKSRAVPTRFAQGSATAATAAAPAARPAVAKLVPVSFRLPAELVQRLRERAIGHEGGISALAAEALARGLEASPAKR